MDLLLGISFLVLLIVMAMGLGQNKPKNTVAWTPSDYTWFGVVLLVLVSYGFIVYG